VAQRITRSDPCIGAIWKKEEEEGNPKYLSIQQGKALVKLMEEYSVFNTIVKVLLLTGMRSGECLGLRWDCINFEDKTITVNRTLAYANNRWYLDSPKSKNSRRTFDFDDKLYEILRRYKEEQDKVKEIVGSAWQQPDMVFTSYTGHWYDRSLLNTQFRRFMRSHTEFPYITIHGLRHTYAALLIYEKESIEVISKQLGHSSVDITSRVYSHILTEVMVRVAKSVSSTLFD